MKKYSVLDYGCEPNSEKVQTKCIQSAVDACFLSGGGEVVIPGGDYLTGDIRLRSNVYLHLEKGAHLIGTRNPDDYFNWHGDSLEPLGDEYITDCLWEPADKKDRDYSFMCKPGSRWNNGIIRAVFAENCGIIGDEGSYIDGCDCYDEQNEEQYRGPHAVSMWYCRNVRLCGYTVQNSGNWAHALHRCENIDAKNITVLAGHDGFHPTCCKNVYITDCDFYTGDDCIAGYANINVFVSGCRLNSACSALRLGATNAVIEKCRIWGPCRYTFRKFLTLEEKKSGAAPKSSGMRTNMLSAFTYYSDTAFPTICRPGNIVMKDCEIDFADRLFHYNFSGNETWQKGYAMDSFTFENIRAENIAMPLVCYGKDDCRIDFKMTDSLVSYRKGCENVPFIHANNYRSIELKNVELKNNVYSPCILTWQSGGEICMQNLRSDIPEQKFEIGAANSDFACESI